MCVCVCVCVCVCGGVCVCASVSTFVYVAHAFRHCTVPGLTVFSAQLAIFTDLSCQLAYGNYGAKMVLV